MCIDHSHIPTLQTYQAPQLRRRHGGNKMLQEWRSKLKGLSQMIVNYHWSDGDGDGDDNDG